MEGYTIMAKELREEFEQLNDWPTMYTSKLAWEASQRQ